MSQSRNSPPLYQMVVNTLQSEIVRGIYSVGTLLPSEASLVSRFNVSRQTVRSAIRSLREAGLVESHQGLGTRVRSLGATEGFIHHVSTISDLFPVNVETRYDPVKGQLISLPKDMRSFTNSEKERTWLHVRGYRFAESADHPFNEIDIFVAGRFAGVGRVLNSHSGSVYAAIEMIYGETVSEVHQVISGFTADEDRGSRIGLNQGEAGIEVRRIFRIASDNDIAMASMNRYRADNFTFSLTLQRMKS